MQSRFRSGRIVSIITGGPITMDDICNQQLDRNSTNYKLRDSECQPGLQQMRLTKLLASKMRVIILLERDGEAV